MNCGAVLRTVMSSLERPYRVAEVSRASTTPAQPGDSDEDGDRVPQPVFTITEKAPTGALGPSPG